MPGSRWRFVFDLIAAFVCVVTGVGVPIGLVYLDSRSLSAGPLGAIMSITDALWILGIVANFRTAFIRHGEIESGLVRIAFRYARTWLACDLLTAWPLLFLAHGESTVGRTIQAAKGLRLLRLPPLCLKIEHFTITRLYPAQLALIAMLVCNILSCGWRAVSGGDHAAGSTIDTSVAQDWTDLYVADFYFVMMSMSTVGFGDIYPSGMTQQLYVILVMCIAPLIFGAVISLISRSTEGMFNDELAAQVKRTVNFMKDRGVPQDLSFRVQRNLRRNAMHESRMTLAPEVLAQLSPAIQRELLSELLRTTVLEFPLFKAANNAFIGEIAQAHSWVHCLPGDVVVEDGQLMLEMVFVIRGKLILENSNPPVEFEVVETEDTYGAGAWFGEACLFEIDRTRDFTAVALVEAELAVLIASDYHTIVGKYPRVLNRHRHIVASLQNGKLRLDMLAYRESAMKDQQSTSKFGMLFRSILPDNRVAALD